MPFSSCSLVSCLDGSDHGGIKFDFVRNGFAQGP